MRDLDTIPPISPADLMPVVALVDNRSSLVWFQHRNTEEPESLCQELDKACARGTGVYERAAELDVGEDGYSLFDATDLPALVPGTTFDRDTLVEKAPLLGHYRRVAAAAVH